AGRKPPGWTVKHLLCPDVRRFEFAMRRELSASEGRPYTVTAALEMMPLWLAYGQQCGLIDEALARQSLENVKGVQDWMIEYCNTFPDPAITQVLARWPKPA